MAAKPDIIAALEGHWIMSHKTSDKFEDVLTAQGVGWVVRKLITNSTPRVQITFRSIEEDGKTIWVMRSTTSGVGPTTNTREVVLNGKESAIEDPLFGTILSIPQLSEDGKTLVVTSRSEKGGWDTVTTWVVTADGKVNERSNEFKSKTLTKSFIMRYEKDA